jgi:hypothetical protein
VFPSRAVGFGGFCAMHGRPGEGGFGGLGGLGAFEGLCARCPPTPMALRRAVRSLSAPSAADSAHHLLYPLPCRPITTPTPLGGAAAFHLLVWLSLSLVPGYPDLQERPHAGSHPSARHPSSLTHPTARHGHTLAGLAASVGRTWLSIRTSSRVLLPPDATALPQRCFG